MKGDMMDRLAKALIDVFGKDHVVKDSLSITVGEGHAWDCDDGYSEREVVIKFKHIVKC